MRDHHRGHSFASVLGRIFVLLAIITGVPVMMWTITAFMRAYVAQPVIPGPQRLSPAFAAGAPPNAAVDAATAGPGASTAQYADTGAGATDTQDGSGGGRSDRYGDGSSNAALPPAALANAAVAALTRAAAPPAAGAVALPPQDNGAMQMPPQAPPAFAPARPPDFTSTLAARHGPVIEPPTPPEIAADEQLPPPHPLRGPVPLPPRRPNIVASVATPAPAPGTPAASGAVPLPRGRPTAAPPPTPAGPELPPSNYDSAGMTHY
jgi:hypothetical protein